jgi:hypothetical protein
MAMTMHLVMKVVAICFYVLHIYLICELVSTFVASMERAAEDDGTRREINATGCKDVVELNLQYALFHSPVLRGTRPLLCKQREWPEGVWVEHKRMEIGWPVMGCFEGESFFKLFL